MEIVPGGRHFAESRNCFGKGFNEIIDLRIGIILAEAEEYISLGERFRQADGGENRWEAHGFGNAGCAGSDGDTFCIEHEREPFAFDEFDADVEIGGVAMFARGGAVELEVSATADEILPGVALEGSDVGIPFGK